MLLEEEHACIRQHMREEGEHLKRIVEFRTFQERAA